jgi:hypothetical protein
MTTMIHPNENGRKRPNLGEQINRLDSMLDGLSEGLNDAVADAVKVAVGDAVRQAVQSVLAEVLTNPEIIAKLHPAMTPAPAQPANQAAVVGVVEVENLRTKDEGRNDRRLGGVFLCRAFANWLAIDIPRGRGSILAIRTTSAPKSAPMLEIHGIGA